jgi:hypothetical protein
MVAVDNGRVGAAESEDVAAAFRFIAALHEPSWSISQQIAC